MNPEINPFTWVNIQTDSSAKTTPDKSETYETGKTTNKRNTTITYNNVELTLNGKGKAIVTTTTGFPTTFTIKDVNDVTTCAARYSLDGVDQGEIGSCAFKTNALTIKSLAQQTLTTDVTEEEAKAAIANGSGYITKTYTVEYSVYNSDAATGYKAGKGKNTTSPIATVTEVITVKINVNNLVLKPNKGTEEVWNAEKAKEYAAQLAAEKEAQGTVEGTVNSTETKETGSQKDDVPKTGEVFPMALVGIMALGTVAGGYTVKSVRE